MDLLGCVDETEIGENVKVEEWEWRGWVNKTTN